MDPHAYTPMPEGGILLDLTSCRDWGTVQDAIRRAFFPGPLRGKLGCHVGLSDGPVLGDG